MVCEPVPIQGLPEAQAGLWASEAPFSLIPSHQSTKGLSPLCLDLKRVYFRLITSHSKREHYKNVRLPV